MRVAIPTNSPGGLKAQRSEHFGHCDMFTIVNLGPGNEVEQVETLANGGHEAGGCLQPVRLLQDAGVNAIVVGGMGFKPMQGFSQAGISVYFANPGAAANVETVVSQFCQGQLPVMHGSQACQGAGNCQH